MKIRTRKQFIKKYIIIIHNNKSNKNVDLYYSIIKKLIFKVELETIKNLLQLFEG